MGVSVQGARRLPLRGQRFQELGAVMNLERDREHPLAVFSIICSNLGVERFSVQRTPDGYVVIDLASAACTPDDLEQADAEGLVAELNARVAAGHDIAEVRSVLPQQVEARTWHSAGVIDVWLYDKNSDQWLARLADETGRVEWCAGSDLRPEPMSPDQVGAAARAERMAS